MTYLHPTPLQAYAARVLASASEDEVTAALYLSPDFESAHLGALELMELHAAHVLDGTSSRAQLSDALRTGQRARLTAAHLGARSVLAAQH